MSDFAERVKDELCELSQKIDALTVFMAGPVYAALPQAERERLKAQRSSMRTYEFILAWRVDSDFK